MTRPFGHAFLTELADLLDLHIDGTQDADDVERQIAQALITRIRELKTETERLKTPLKNLLILQNGLLVEQVNECTCYGGGPYGHEPGCGVEPVLDLTQIEGWPNIEQLEAAIQRIRDMHPREAIATHEGYGVEEWCPNCRLHYPCPAIQALEES